MVGSIPPMAASPIPMQDRPEGHLITIAAGWFSMGSDAGENKVGQDTERPAHRVWVDEFFLAACQVTNAEYSRFLLATGNPPPPFWSDHNFIHPELPVVAVSWFEAV